MQRRKQHTTKTDALKAIEHYLGEGVASTGGADPEDVVLLREDARVVKDTVLKLLRGLPAASFSDMRLHFDYRESPSCSL